MSDKPNVPDLIEDPGHPDFKAQIVDADGVAWCAMWDAPEGAELDMKPQEVQRADMAAWGTPTWERLSA